ncbi:MAG: Fur family transcriptional regulator, zinc uptake regulator [Methyloprofundus sp.]|nr:MAG: Fur family transcriptional regulator, zinc uptake regulator [Methyloprofundus sp.]
MNNPIDSKIIQQPHNHKSCQKQALQVAEKICTKKGLRLTPIRRRILELICTSHKAIGAYELLDIYHAEDPKAKPVTIYRTLDFLIEAGLVHKIESINAFIGCLQAETQHKSAILICEQCSNAYEIDASSVYDSLFALSQAIQFTPHCLTLELHGVCSNCSEQ